MVTQLCQWQSFVIDEKRIRNDDCQYCVLYNLFKEFYLTFIC